MTLPRLEEVRRGRAESPPAYERLRAGPLDLRLGAAGDLRRIRMAGVEVVRALLMTVRDEDWVEVTPRHVTSSVDAHRGGFSATLRATYEHGDLGLSADAWIEGDESGSITYGLNATALRAFRYCRIGLCVLHPPSCAGGSFHATTRAGQIEGTLPTRIGVQAEDGGVYRALFDAFDRVEILDTEGNGVVVDVEGDLFEMEDQRNWTDGSFKTYSPPLDRGYPFDARPDQHFRQRVTVTPRAGDRRLTRPPSAGDLVLELGAPVAARIPRLGVAASERPLTPREARLLRSLDLDHLKVTVDLGRDSAAGAVQRGSRMAKVIGCELELSLHLSDEPDGGIRRLAALLHELEAPVGRILLSREGEETTSASSVQVASDALESLLPGAPVYGGTRLDFAELNRTRPELGSLAGVGWTINPQTHAYDDTSLVETLEIQAETVRSARVFCGDLPLAVSGVTLKPPLGPQAGSSGALPADVDPRQMSLFGAAWTLGSVKYLSEGGADSVTFYETTGWRGLLETSPSRSAPAFPSFPGMVFPLYHVLADAADLRMSVLLSAHSSDSLRLIGLAGERPDASVVLLLANLEPRRNDVSITGLTPGVADLRILDEGTATMAGREPSRFRSGWSERGIRVRRAPLSLPLRPYSVTRLEIASESAPRRRPRGS